MTSQTTAPKVHIVLHQSIYPSNIGAAVRAMGNMSADRLILVDPKCKVNSQAKRAAVGCQELLSGRTVYSSWEEFYKNEGAGIRIGFTARAGKLRPALDAEDLFEELRVDDTGALAENPNLYLVFGREDSGLSGNDVELLHHTCTIETSGQYTSLNLAQAVLLGLYVLRKYFPRQKEVDTANSDATDTRKSPPNAFYPEPAIREWLETLGFDLSAKRINALKVMNQLLLRNRPSEKELRILEVVLQQTIRKLSEGKKDEL